MASLVSHVSRLIPATTGGRWRNHAAELSLFAGCYLLYLFLRGLIFEGDAQALANAERVIALETSLGIFFEEPLQQWCVTFAKPVVLLLNLVYIVTYWPVILGAALLLYLNRHSLYNGYRNLIVAHLLLALAIFTLFPLAPPFKTGLLADTIQLYGPSFYGSPEMASFYNTNAAMPSLHFSWTCILAWLFLREVKGWYRYLGIAYPLLTLAAILVTGNHFLLDAAVGAALIPLAYLVAKVGERGWKKWSESQHRRFSGKPFSP
ncbi:MAG: inositol phosphorylceramide synthase [Chloroflexi bacterium]|nr:inositol phosphorylceramide synthase [Chloroflexota bacterium]